MKSKNQKRRDPAELLRTFGELCSKKSIKADDCVSRVCGTCRHWQQTGIERAGILNFLGNEEWIYPVGRCTHAPSIGTRAGKDGIPSFGLCYLWNKCKPSLAMRQGSREILQNSPRRRRAIAGSGQKKGKVAI